MYRGISFPLTSTFPPKLRQLKSIKDYSFVNGNGVAYLEPVRQSDPNRLKLTAMYLEKVSNPEAVSAKDITYFSNTSKALSKDKGEDGVAVTVGSQETQIWSDDNDWLWLEMERTDADGNITMRCRRMK
jgi:hypothetical protein